MIISVLILVGAFFVAWRVSPREKAEDAFVHGAGVDLLVPEQEHDQRTHLTLHDRSQLRSELLLVIRRRETDRLE